MHLLEILALGACRRKECKSPQRVVSPSERLDAGEGNEGAFRPMPSSSELTAVQPTYQYATQFLSEIPVLPIDIYF